MSAVVIAMVMATKLAAIAATRMLKASIARFVDEMSVLRAKLVH